MEDRETVKVHRKHDFVPAEQYLREKPLCASLMDTATFHVLESKRLTRSMADFTAGYYSGRGR